MALLDDYDIHYKLFEMRKGKYVEITPNENSIMIFPLNLTKEEELVISEFIGPPMIDNSLNTKLKQGKITFGRDENNGIYLPLKEIAEQHGEFYYEDGKINYRHLTDEASFVWIGDNQTAMKKNLTAKMIDEQDALAGTSGYVNIGEMVNSESRHYVLQLEPVKREPYVLSFTPIF